MNDNDLLSRFAEHQDNQAFRELVARHLNLVHSAALRRCGGDVHQANEVTQMVFIDLARKAARLTRHPLLAAWLHEGTRLAASKLRRSAQRRARNEQRAASDPSQTPDPGTTVLDWAQVRPVVDAALDELPGVDRHAVLLRYFENREFGEIGERLGMPANTARMRVTRALDKLCAALGKRGIRSSAAVLGAALSANTVAAAPAGLAESVTTTALAQAGTAAFAGGLLGLLGKQAFQITAAALLILGLGAGLLLSLRAGANAKSHLAFLQAENTRLAASLAREKATATEPTTPAVKPPSNAPSPVQARRFQLDTLIRKGELDRSHAPLFQRLRLPKPTLDAFKTLLVERNQAVFDALHLGKAADGLGELMPREERQLAEVAMRPTNARIAALIGQQGLDLLNEYETGIGWNYTALTYTTPGFLSFDKPFTPEEQAGAKMLQDLFTRHHPDYEQSLYLEQSLIPLSKDFLEQAKSLLPADDARLRWWITADTPTQAKVIDLARKAAAEGRLYLKKNSAQEYGVGLTPTNTATKATATLPGS